MEPVGRGRVFAALRPAARWRHALASPTRNPEAGARGGAAGAAGRSGPTSGGRSGGRPGGDPARDRRRAAAEAQVSGGGRGLGACSRSSHWRVVL